MKHLYLIYFLLLPVAFAQNNVVPDYDLYFNKIEDGQYIQVFTKPGVNWRYCEKEIDPATGKEKCKDGIGWLDRNSKARIIGSPKKEKVQDPISGEWIEEEYIEIEFFYPRIGANGELITKMEKGYIETYNLSKEQLGTFYKKIDEPIEPPLKPVTPTLPGKDCTSTSQSLKDLQALCKPIVEATENLGVEKSAKILNDVVGFCAVSPPTKLPSQIPHGNVYDALVYSKLKNKPVPRIKKENKEYMTQDDLVNIDSLARTLYGEMAKCYRYGLEYPMTVAKIITNRTNDPDGHRTFIQGQHAPGKPTAAKVATTGNQFSMWLRNAGGPLHHGLCPPRELGKPFYRSKSASKFENDIWVSTMRIATEAVLYPEQFAKRTAGVKGKHYTSNLAKDRFTNRLSRGGKFIENMIQVFPKIAGRTVNYNRCLEAWVEKPKKAK